MRHPVPASEKDSLVSTLEKKKRGSWQITATLEERGWVPSTPPPPPPPEVPGFRKKAPRLRHPDPPDEKNHSTIGTRIERAEARENREFPAWHRSSDEARIQIGATPNTRQVMRGYISFLCFFILFMKTFLRRWERIHMCTLM